MTRYIVTASPPNPNGDMHLGHLAGPFLGADVQARYLRNSGHDVTHVTYIDEHSCYVPRRARELGAEAYETAHVLGTRIEETLAMANMGPDFCGRPHRDTWHDQIVQHYFTRLWDEGKLDVAETDVYYCATDDQILYEAEIRGKCHYCEAPSDGFYCEECGRPQEAGRLLEPVCTTCGSAPELRRQRRIFFPLEQYREQLTEHFASMPARPRLRAYLDMMFAQPLPDTPISRLGDYGVPVPLEDWAGHYLDTWFSGIWGYVAASEGAQRVARHGDGQVGWHDPATEVLEFLGFDCSFSHAILWSAFSLALKDVPLPTRINTNEFYKLEGGKFSTSRGHAIWGGQYLTEVPADSLRFYLCLTGPETEQTNFARADFEKSAETVLVDGLEVLVGAFDDSANTGSSDDERLTALIDEVTESIDAALAPERFSPAAAASVILELCSTRLGEAISAATGSSAEARLTSLQRLARSIEPIMPGWASDLWAGLDSTRPALQAMAISPAQHSHLVTVAGRTVAVRALSVVPALASVG